MKKSITLFLLVLFFSLPLYSQETYDGCPPEGKVTIKNTNVKATHEQWNRLKNRYKDPNVGDFNDKITFETFLNEGQGVDGVKLDELKAAKIKAYVLHVKDGGKEDCNCGESDPMHIDTHIELVRSTDKGDTVKTMRVIVEVTPRIKSQMKKKNIDCTTDGLMKFEHHYVIFSGWLFKDDQHKGNAYNTAKNKKSKAVWRRTVWEIHPVLQIECQDCN